MARFPSQSREQPQNGREDSRPWRCCRGAHVSRGWSSYVDRRLSAGFASSCASAARGYSIRLARHTAGRFVNTPRRALGARDLAIDVDSLVANSEISWRPPAGQNLSLVTPCSETKESVS